MYCVSNMKVTPTVVALVCYLLCYDRSCLLILIEHKMSERSEQDKQR